MGRTVLAVTAGVVVGLLIACVIGWFSEYAFPPSVLVDMDLTLARTRPMPLAEVFTQLLGWVLAALAGGALAARIADLGQWPAWATTAVLGISVVALAIWRPHPLWFVILSVAVVAATGFGAGWLSARSAERAAA